jgi:hypothetical protein
MLRKALVFGHIDCIYGQEDIVGDTGRVRPQSLRDGRPRRNWRRLGPNAPARASAYLMLKMDDTSFNTPIYANLFDDEDGENYSLI